MLLNKSVYFSIPEIVYFLYPSYKKILSIENIWGNEVLYFSRPDEKVSEVKKKLLDSVSSFILIVPSTLMKVDEIFSDVYDFLFLVSEVKKIRFSKQIVPKCKKLSEDEFFNFLKMSIALNKWYTDIFEVKGKSYQLFNALYEGRTEFLKQYFSLLKTKNYEEIFSYILTFMGRIESYDEQKEALDNRYSKTIRKNKQFESGMKEALKKMLFLSDDIPRYLRYLNFYLECRV